MSFETESEKDYIVIDDHVNGERWCFDSPKSITPPKDSPPVLSITSFSGGDFDIKQAERGGKT